MAESSIKIPSCYWAIEASTVSKAHAVSANSTTNGTITATATMAGFYPIGVIGYRITGTNASNLILYEVRLTSASLGSATVEAQMRNVASSASNGTFYWYILWVKAS